MSYLEKVLYHGFKLQAAVNKFQNHEFVTDTLPMERAYDKVMYFVNREREVYGDQAMEDLYDALTPEILEAISYADFIIASLPEEDLTEL
jgi:hypothetical protein